MLVNRHEAKYLTAIEKLIGKPIARETIELPPEREREHRPHHGHTRRHAPHHRKPKGHEHKGGHAKSSRPKGERGDAAGLPPSLLRSVAPPKKSDVDG
jgi:hypothetical protein